MRFLENFGIGMALAGYFAVGGWLYVAGRSPTPDEGGLRGWCGRHSFVSVGLAFTMLIALCAAIVIYMAPINE